MSDIAAELRRMRGQGLTHKQMAEALGVGKWRVVSLCKRHGVKLHRAAWRVERVRELARTELSQKQIAVMLGVSRDAVRSICHIHKIETHGHRWKTRGHLKETSCHPLVRQLVHRMNEEQTTQGEVEKRAGLGNGVIGHWRKDAMPRLDAFIAAANVMGYELVLRRIDNH